MHGFFYYFVFKLCSVIGPNIASYKLKENIQNLTAIAKEIFENLKVINLFTVKFHFFNYFAEDKSKFETKNRFDLSSTNNIIFFGKNFYKNRFNTKISTLEKAVKALNSCASHDNIIELKLNSGERIVLVQK